MEEFAYIFYFLHFTSCLQDCCKIDKKGEEEMENVLNW